MMTEQKLLDKIENATNALEIFLKKLDETEAIVWRSYFETIGNCLNQKDVECVVRSWEVIPFPNMGGFGEFLDSHPELRQQYNNLYTKVQNLKLYYRYEKDRPMVNNMDSLPTMASADRGKKPPLPLKPTFCI